MPMHCIIALYRKPCIHCNIDITLRIYS